MSDLEPFDINSRLSAWLRAAPFRKQGKPWARETAPTSITVLGIALDQVEGK